jgi:hypothetical protein
MVAVETNVAEIASPFASPTIVPVRTGFGVPKKRETESADTLSDAGTTLIWTLAEADVLWSMSSGVNVTESV